MKLIYTTLNTSQEARDIAKKLLEARLANCVNFFPITCMYNYQDKITEEAEVVMIIKTQEGMFSKIEKIIKQHIKYDNFIGQIDVEAVNDTFTKWLDGVVR